jgi:hypothetical protein
LKRHAGEEIRYSASLNYRRLEKFVRDTFYLQYSFVIMKKCLPVLMEKKMGRDHLWLLGTRGLIIIKLTSK